MNKKVTLEDIAKKAGVSLATASGALNEVPKFSAETIARVRQAMRELDYKPRPNKLRDKSIKRHRVKGVGTIAFVFPDSHPETIATPLSVGMLKGVEETLLESGRRLKVVQISDNNPLPKILKNKKTDGVIIRSGTHISPELRDQLKGIPTVFALNIAFGPEEFDSVRPDNEAIGHIASEHLLSRGHKRLMTVRIGLNNAIAIRAISFQLACEQRGATCEVLQYKTNSAEKVAAKIAKMNPRPDALFWPGAIKDIAPLLEEKGIPIGKNLDVVCGNSTLDDFNMYSPNIAGVGYDPVEIGRAAARQITWRIDHPHDLVRKTLIPATLVTK